MSGLNDNSETSQNYFTKQKNKFASLDIEVLIYWNKPCVPFYKGPAYIDAQYYTTDV